FPSKHELVARYAATSGRDIGDVDFYVAFGYWKLACILEGVYARYRGGVMGETSGYEGFAVQVETLASRARATVEGRERWRDAAARADRTTRSRRPGPGAGVGRLDRRRAGGRRGGGSPVRP